MTPSTTPLTTARRPRLARWFTDTGCRHVVGILACIFAVFPLLYILSVSLDSSGTLTGSNRLFESFDLTNYINLFTTANVPFGRWFANTLVIGIVTSVATVFLGALAAYAFSRMRFTGRRLGLLTLLLVQLFPQFLAVVAIFLLMINIGRVFPAIGIGTHAGLIMIYLGGALGVNTFLMYGFFNTVPVSIDEAAKIDGAGHARTFFTIVLPLVTPILAVVGLLSFISVTSEFIIASVMLTTPEDQTLALGLYTLVSGFQSQNWGIFAAGSVIAALPVVALFLFLQRFIVSGLSAGSVK
ncbi:sugar ABC transporter permease [Microbacterium sp. Bi128]|uniref:sugar ABC transporter permease n=1 Tax=Microbacterium sp. Bi128 TaxID=2821115 RepID=UPI001D377B71|nr:sugar ABC transporter permease [Microbacterium sp. Bi128]CAH0218341.1 Maltose transport system permease protein MalG [Microbacterium sp. Bi128]